MVGWQVLCKNTETIYVNFHFLSLLQITYDSMWQLLTFIFDGSLCHLYGSVIWCTASFHECLLGVWWWLVDLPSLHSQSSLFLAISHQYTNRLWLCNHTKRIYSSKIFFSKWINNKSEENYCNSWMMYRMQRLSWKQVYWSLTGVTVVTYWEYFTKDHIAYLLHIRTVSYDKAV